MTARRAPRWAEIRPLLQVQSPGGRKRRLARAASISDLRAVARRRTPRAVFDYVDGAAGDEISLRRSRDAFARVEFRPSTLRDVSRVDTGTSVLGRRSPLPFAFAPTGFTRMINHEGEVGGGARCRRGSACPWLCRRWGRRR